MTPPTKSDFKTQFSRDFPFGSTSETVTDTDIDNALTEASVHVNESLFSTETIYKLAYNYMAAHCLVTNLKNSSQGIAGAFSWLENSKSVGSVSQSFSIPDSILQNPLFAMFSKTTYGAKYLSLCYAQTIGQVQVAGGATLA